MTVYHMTSHVWIFKRFNGKLLLRLTSTKWAKNSSFWALFGGMAQHITPYLLNASTCLQADCIIRTANCKKGRAVAENHSAMQGTCTESCQLILGHSSEIVR